MRVCLHAMLGDLRSSMIIAGVVAHVPRRTPPSPPLTRRQGDKCGAVTTAAGGGATPAFGGGSDDASQSAAALGQPVRYRDLEDKIAHCWPPASPIVMHQFSPRSDTCVTGLLRMRIMSSSVRERFVVVDRAGGSSSVNNES